MARLNKDLSERDLALRADVSRSQVRTAHELGVFTRADGWLAVVLVRVYLASNSLMLPGERRPRNSPVGLLSRTVEALACTRIAADNEARDVLLEVSIAAARLITQQPGAGAPCPVLTLPLGTWLSEVAPGTRVTQGSPNEPPTSEARLLARPGRTQV